jgi:hypothetical protein
MAIVFVTGVSTAGKTTTYEKLRKDPELSHIAFHDIDEDGIPRAGTGAWRQFRVELLLHEAVQRFYSAERKSTVICGVTKPHEVIESGAFPDVLPVHFILIDVTLANIRKRLAERIGSRYPADDVEYITQSNRLLSHTLRKSVSCQRNGVIFDPARMSRTKMCQEIKALILSRTEYSASIA